MITTTDKIGHTVACFVVGIGLGFMGGMIKADDFTNAISKKLTGHTFGEMNSLIEGCQKNLPRDKFCKIQIKVVEDK